jgi:hypothetical protein
MQNTLKMLNKKSLAVLLIFFSNTQSYADCTKPETLFEEKDCQYQDYEAETKNLDAEFKKFSKRTIDKKEATSKNKERIKKNVIESQNTWKKYVKTHCDLATLLENESNTAQNELLCETELIRQRIQTLRNSPF